jgi:hypothetical protein
MSLVEVPARSTSPNVAKSHKPFKSVESIAGHTTCSHWAARRVDKKEKTRERTLNHLYHGNAKVMAWDGADRETTAVRSPARLERLDRNPPPKCP